MAGRHPYDHEIGRLERLLELAGAALGSELKGSKAQGALYVGSAQEVLRAFGYRLFNDYAEPQTRPPQAPSEVNK